MCPPVLNLPGAYPRQDRAGMQIKILDENKEFSAKLHFAVIDPDKAIVCASFAGLNTAVNAIESAIICGIEGEITRDGETPISFRSRFGHYKRGQHQGGNGITHGMIIDKNALFEVNKEALNNNRPVNPIIVAPNGNIEEMVGKFLTACYALPPEWENQYYSLIRERVQSLETIVNTNYPSEWNQIQAVRLVNVNQEFIEDKIENSLKGGQLVIPHSEMQGEFNSSWTASEYTQANAPILAQQVGAVKARFTPGVDNISPHLASMKRIPFPAQAFCIQGIVNTLEKRFDAYCIGDMGTGKTIQALGIMHVLHKEKGIRRVLVTAPGLVIPKWAEEIRKTIPYAKIRVINRTEDAIKMVQEYKKNKKPKHLEIVLLSIDRAKFGPEPWFAGHWRRVENAKYNAWHCPDCSKPLPANDIYNEFKAQLGNNPDTLPEIYADWTDLVDSPRKKPEETIDEPALLDLPVTGNGVTQGYINRWKKKSKLRVCPYCGTRLWRPAVKSRGETRLSPRWFICKILKKAGKIFDLYTADEIHQTKAGDSGRGFAFAQMIKSAKKFVGLTGTLTTGKSTSIKHILWRTDPAKLIREGFPWGTGDWTWAQRYGVIEQLVDKDDIIEDEGVITVRKGSKARIQEMPGISPELTATYLLDRSVFLELGDIGLPLPELKEIPIFVTMDEDSGHKEAYRNLHENMYQSCAQAAQAGNAGAFSTFIPTVINFADRPDLGAYAEVGNEVFQVPAFDENYYHAKERKLVEIVQQELAEGRRMVIYTKYSKQYKMNERLQKVLKDHGIDSVILSSSVSPDQRIEWVEQEAEKGTKIIICNLELLSVGVDLLPYPTIIKFQMDFRVNEERQNSRRHWRLNQHRECRTYYLVYDETYQMAQFKRVMAGRGQAMFVEGRIDRSELAEFAMDENISMAYNITECLADSDLADKWVRLAAKDIDQNIEMVREDKFLEAREAAMKKLINETLRLCGVDPADLENEVVEEPEQQPEIVCINPESFPTDTDTPTDAEEMPSDVIVIDEIPRSNVIVIQFSTPEENNDSVEMLTNSEPVPLNEDNIISLFGEDTLDQLAEQEPKPKQKKHTRRKKKKQLPEEELSLFSFAASDM